MSFKKTIKIFFLLLNPWTLPPPTITFETVVGVPTSHYHESYDYTISKTQFATLT